MTAWILAHLSRWLETVRIDSLSNLSVASILKFSAPSIENSTLHWVDRVTLKSYASMKQSSHQQRRRYICPPSITTHALIESRINMATGKWKGRKQSSSPSLQLHTAVPGKMAQSIFVPSPVHTRTLSSLGLRTMNMTKRVKASGVSQQERWRHRIPCQRLRRMTVYNQRL